MNMTSFSNLTELKIFPLIITIYFVSSTGPTNSLVLVEMYPDKTFEREMYFSIFFCT